MLPSESRAVTVMVAVPSELAVTVTAVMADVDPSMAADAAAIEVSEDDAWVTVTASPSESLNTPAIEMVRLSSASSPLMSSMGESTAGAAFTFTVKSSHTSPPLPSAAFTPIDRRSPCLGRNRQRRVIGCDGHGGHALYPRTRR